MAANYLFVRIAKELSGNTSRADKERACVSSGDVHRHLFSHSKIKRNECPLGKDLDKSLQAQGGEKGLLRVALLVVFWRWGVHQWLLLACGVRSGRKLLFLPVLKAEAGLGEEAAVGEDTEDVEHPVSRLVPSENGLCVTTTGILSHLRRTPMPQPITKESARPSQGERVRNALWRRPMNECGR
jgi:hypothetical protein